MKDFKSRRAESASGAGPKTPKKTDKAVKPSSKSSTKRKVKSDPEGESEEDIPVKKQRAIKEDPDAIRRRERRSVMSDVFASAEEFLD